MSDALRQESIVGNNGTGIVHIGDGLDAVDRAARLRTLSTRQTDAIIVISQAELEAYLEEVGGAKGISVPDVLEPQQISAAIYIGATSPRATTEVPHWHPDQDEVYEVVHGHAEIIAKWRWEKEWTATSLHAGDMLIVRPETCHWFRWLSSGGLARVFKAPQRAGVGRFPAGKVVCQWCPHFHRTCEPPAIAAAE